MVLESEYRLGVDWSTFDPWRVQGPFPQNLATHPLLQWDALLELVKRLEPKGQFRSHTAEAKPGTSFSDAPRLFRNRKSAVDVASSLSDADAWMSLLNVQTDPVYRALVAQILDDVRAHIDPVDPGMSYRAGWIFLASPKAVTPFHFDVEHNFILQLRGHKTLYVWDPDDRVAASEDARDLFHAHHDRSLVTWREELRERAHKFHLRPGFGVYMPSTSPHMVENDDNPSLTMSFTYYTASTRRNRNLHRARLRLRRLGLAPPPVGQNGLFDMTALTAWRGALALRHGLKRLAGHKAQSETVSYAPHLMG